MLGCDGRTLGDVPAAVVLQVHVILGGGGRTTRSPVCENPPPRLYRASCRVSRALDETLGIHKSRRENRAPFLALKEEGGPRRQEVGLPRKLEKARKLIPPEPPEGAGLPTSAQHDLSPARPQPARPWATCELQTARHRSVLFKTTAFVAECSVATGTVAGFERHLAQPRGGARPPPGRTRGCGLCSPSFGEQRTSPHVYE